MEKISYKGKSGVFMEAAEFEQLQSKILEQKKLIVEFEKEMKV